ncbi:hypothetical protein AVEN_194500-1 [Araneus ventricosus]|uniref:DUF7041 domain-containing protein n=1 Tax=Araneus ventricosus TaxID=182803 RepID=A0A4Y2A7E1_ARAVE|nr:hypothetical protein AVEN_194500-1 [Araneus ventricosus]
MVVWRYTTSADEYSNIVYGYNSADEGKMESQFMLTSEITKFHQIVAVLQPEELEVVGDIMLNPPADEPYDAHRKRLCSQYAIRKNND